MGESLQGSGFVQLFCLQIKSEYLHSKRQGTARLTDLQDPYTYGIQWGFEACSLHFGFSSLRPPKMY